MRKLLFAIAAASLVASGFVAPAIAVSPVTIQITDAQLAARVQVTLSFDVVCQPLGSFAGPGTVMSAAFGAAASVDQAAGTSIAHAEGGNVMVDPSYLVICDGVTVNHESISMVSSTVPFHGGPAVASVTVNVDDPNCMWCGFGEHAGTSETVKLH